MLRTIAVLLGLSASVPVFACEPIFSDKFARPPEKASVRPLPLPIVKVDTFIPGLPAQHPGDSCEGVAILVISVQMPHDSPVSVKRLGFEIRQVSGTAAPGYMPDAALIPRRTADGGYALYYGWTELPRDADGHVRWNLEVVAVTRAGRRSAAVPLRVASDNPGDG